MINLGQTLLVRNFRGRLRLVLALAVFPLTIFGTAPTAYADQVTERVELEIKSVHIYDHREPVYELEGEIRLEARLWRVHQIEGCPRWTHDEGCIETLASMTVSFDASSGDTVTIGRTLPDQRSAGVGKYADPSGPGIGIALRGDEVYGWEISAVDEDAVIDDLMGWLRGELSRANGWGTPGEYDERGWVQCDDEGVGGFCALFIMESPFNPPDAKAAHFSVVYELRRTPLPDLFASGFRYDTQRGAVCMRVMNVGSRAAEPFAIQFRADATPSAEATQQSYWFLNGLGVNESQEPCLNPLLPAGEWAVSFIIDEADGVLEGNEGNNRYDSKFTFLTFGPSGPQSIAPPPQGPVPANPVTGQADLTVTGIQVKGENARGNGGCDPGKNEATVSVKNQGTGPAASFSVRLKGTPEHDDDDDVSVEKSVASLDAGAEQDVQFNDLRLKKGFYEFEASVDAKRSVAESNENNNDDHVSVNCQT